MKRSTAAERRHKARVAALGCCNCGADGENHHVKIHPGQPRDDCLLINICPGHHRIGEEGDAVEKNKAEWERRHGPEMLHVIRTLQQIEVEPEIMTRFLKRMEEVAHRISLHAEAC